jgi:hypothetical protein
MVIVGLLALVMAADKLVPRLTLTTSAIISSVLFHINMTSSLPPVGYLTFADRFMIINYAALILALVSTLFLLYYSEKKNERMTSLTYRNALTILPIGWTALQGLNFLV